MFRNCVSVAISSSVVPSEKYSCAGSPERFSSGSTAIEDTASALDEAGALRNAAEKKLKDTVQAAIQSVATDTFVAGTVAYNAASDPAAIGLAPYHDNADLITPEIQTQIDDAFQGFVEQSLDPCAPVKCTVSGS